LETRAAVLASKTGTKSKINYKHTTLFVLENAGGYMAKLVTGIFPTRASAMLALEDLVRHGFSQDDISLLMSETTRGREFAVEEATKGPEGVAAGAAIGGALGALLLGLTSVGLLAAPGINVFVSGQWLAALAGFGAGALGGGILGGLVGIGIPEHEAELYRGEIEKDGILLGLYCEDEQRSREAEALLKANNASHLHNDNTKDDPKRLRRTA
jgi:hypothetical protein